MKKYCQTAQKEIEHFMKCCENKKCGVKVCINCFAIYHKSCAKRNQQLKILSENKVICCEKTDNTQDQKQFNESEKEMLQLEIRYLKELLEETRDKNNILNINNSLLLDKVGLLEKNYRRNNQPVEDNKGAKNVNINNSNARPGTSNEGKPVTESWNKINSTSMQMPNFQRSDLVPQEKMAHLKQIPQMATYGQIAAKTIVNNPNSGPITYDNPNNKDNFVEVTYRKQNKQNRVYKKNIGTGPSDDISEFSGPERKVWLYLYRVKRAATEEKKKDYITKNQVI
ncbi:hypothetical protein JTB14_011800 [Gonioctena quinquepunctata]|nr:hypothetical protein JTB14_011800 [Gonioctena quinquepunctata]